MSTKRVAERAAVRIARELVSEMRRRRLRPGTQLAAEHRMVEKFGVARATVRESLRFLEHQGALRIKAGSCGGSQSHCRVVGGGAAELGASSARRAQATGRLDRFGSLTLAQP